MLSTIISLFSAYLFFWCSKWHWHCSSTSCPYNVHIKYYKLCLWVKQPTNELNMFGLSLLCYFFLSPSVNFCRTVPPVPEDVRSVGTRVVCSEGWVFSQKCIKQHPNIASNSQKKHIQHIPYKRDAWLVVHCGLFVFRGETSGAVMGETWSSDTLGRVL